MKTYNIIQFEDHEREAIHRALEGLESLVETERRGEPYFPIRSFIHRIQQEEPFDARALEDLASVLTVCIHKLAPETQFSWWRENGAPGEDDAVQGLADTRARQVQLLQEARDLVWEARDLAGEAPATKSEQKALSV